MTFLASKAARSCRILIADSDFAMTREIEGVLRARTSHWVESASTAEQATTRLRAAPYDVLMIDAALPSAAWRPAARRHPRLRVVLIDHAAELPRKMGTVLSCPFDDSKLVETILAAVVSRRSAPPATATAAEAERLRGGR
jgi:DNA-binding NtrC family response regulator